ncbi:MAG: glycosyltransferase involved in cell wall biosynthesis [Flavobacteriaceae bacterium]|jgi:glycosyltransferase involved in cell wall biosynthesis
MSNNTELPKFSIIVPVYNVEKYLVRCLDSIFNQEFNGEVEIIAIDDCSTDTSLAILKSYKNDAFCLKIIEHKENKRLAQARTSGMAVAEGDYIMHVDSDDWLLPNALQDIYDKCIETNADVLVFDYVIENEKRQQTLSNSFKDELITTDKISVQQYFFGACWTKVVKKSMVANMVYSNIEAPRSTEDLIYCTEILLRAEVICLFPRKLYGYFINSSSITQSSNSQKYLNNQIVIAKNLNEIFRNYNPTAKFKDALLDYFSKFLFLSITKAHFYDKTVLPECIGLLEDINNVPLLNASLTEQINKAINNKYYSLFQVARYFNYKLALGILRRSIKK